MVEGKKRGILLTAWLILALIGGIVGIGSYGVILFSPFGKTIQQLIYPNMGSWIFVLLGVLAIIALMFIIATFKWKKWGVYGYCGTFIISPIISLLTASSLFVAIFSIIPWLIGLTIFILLVRRKWDLFE